MNDSEVLLTHIQDIDISILTIKELSKLNELLEEMFTDEIGEWYDSIASGDTFNGRAHHFLASMLDKYIQVTHRAILEKILIRDEL